MPKINSRSREVAERIRDRVPFETYGALKATEETRVTAWDSGRLTGPDLDRFNLDLDSIRYVVWSYATPIAWWSETNGWHRVAQKFSMTTSHHQGKLYLMGDAA